MSDMMISFLSTNEGERYLKGLYRRDSTLDLKYNQVWEGGKAEGETSYVYNSLVITLQRLFKEEPTEIESILRKKNAQDLLRLQNIMFDCDSYEEFVSIVKSEESENKNLRQVVNRSVYGGFSQASRLRR